MTADGNVYSETVRVKIHEATKLAYVPKKGIDMIFEQLDNIPDPQGRKKHEYNVTLVGSDIVPEEKIEQRDLTNVLSQWKSIVSDRVRVQRKEPLRHHISTFIDRPKHLMSDQLNSRIDALTEDQIRIKDGKRFADFVLDVKD